MPKIYVGTYNAYNEGSLNGEWLDLEDYNTYDDFMRACRELHSDESDPELMFQDVEDIPREFVGECWIKPEFWDYMNSDVDDDVKAAFMYLFDEWDEERCNDTYIGKFRSRADLAEDVVDGAGILRDVPDDVARYFDYEAYGQDLELRGDVREYNDHYFWTNY